MKFLVKSLVVLLKNRYLHKENLYFKLWWTILFGTKVLIDYEADSIKNNKGIP